MRGRLLSIGVILFQAIWFNVVVPGHQRGMVQLPGAAGVPRCCCVDDSADDSHAADAGRPHRPQTPEQRAQNCAVCFFCAHVGLPPVFDFHHADLGLLHRVRAVVRDDLFARFVLLPFDCCGPPARC